ncbi:MAG: AbrB/MazE/SpoVT family DNA-binding domain-containing protein [Bryobacteraceae bacterium]|nr:AbrB/MazE/SpoVT family DNA-binding domain-containing protein [Bryobacteraceae bacterium]
MTTRVFKSGNSRAVRIPKEIDLPLGEVEIERRGMEVVLREKPKTMAEALRKIGGSPDFMKNWKRDRRREPHREKVADDLARRH